MTHEEILEQTKAELDRLVYEAKRKLDELATPKLEVGKWYKDTEGSSELLVNITDIKDDGIVGYGFGVYGEWASNTYFYSGNMENAYRFLVEATRQEVEDALALEAKRRGIVEGVSVIDLDDGKGFLLKGGAYLLSFASNKLFAHGITVFKDGIWAEVIKESRTTLDQDIKTLKEKYPNLKFTITIGDNL